MESHAAWTKAAAWRRSFTQGARYTTPAGHVHARRRENLPDSIRGPDVARGKGSSEDRRPAAAPRAGATRQRFHGACPV